MTNTRTAPAVRSARWLLALGLIASPTLLLPACKSGGGGGGGAGGDGRSTAAPVDDSRTAAPTSSSRDSERTASSKGTPQANEPISISTGLNALESGDGAAGETIDPETARRLALMDEAQQNSPVSVDPPQSPRAAAQPPRQSRPSPGSVRPTELAGVDAPPPEPGADIDAAPQNPAAPLNAAQRKAQLAGELAGVLREEASSSSAPASTLARLAALELIQRGVDPTAATASKASSLITPKDAQALAAWREMLDTIGSRLDSGADLSSLAEPLSATAAKLDSAQALRLTSGLLCTKVDGFGAYTEFRRAGQTYKLLAGRKHRMIVYVEVENFGHRSRSQDGLSGYSVELTQELNLYHASTEGDMLAWRKTDQDITDFSRNRRRDFFVVQVIELPETLSIGGYRLKVGMKDKATGASAETIIPIDIVANASALGAAR